MKVSDVFVIKDAVDDLSEGKAFYNLQEDGVGEYFWDCLVTDIESLIIYGGIHSKHSGLYRMNSKRFPYIIYYDIIDTAAYVTAVLPMRKNPAWIQKTLTSRQ